MDRDTGCSHFLAPAGVWVLSRSATLLKAPFVRQVAVCRYN